ncbi:MAG: 2-oxo acid dehydrogenase subunit E2 [Candidatus Helarchaeota archaeon]|nr:2-oxo acid dehydrogenase subunit E2 [Candidatus Helarchaeota archaeon]
MVTQFVMPKLGMTMEEGTIIKWMKKEGDEVQRGEEIVEIETDKVTMKLEAPATGILYKILAAEKDVVPVGKNIALITDPGEEISDITQYIEEKKEIPTTAVAPAAAPMVKTTKEVAGRIFISPRARKLAREKGIDYAGIRGTGPDGRIIEKDILNYLNHGLPTKIEGKSIPLEGIRKIIAKKMSASLSEIPQLTYTSEVDMTETINLRKHFLELYKGEDVKITMTDIIIKTVIEVIKKYPIFNSSMGENAVVIKDSLNLGVAVATDRGLIVPVIHDAESKSLKEISQHVRNLADKARSRTLSLDDVTGGTFTVSNLGMFGIEVFTPIINPPEAAILGIGKMIQKPMVKDGRIRISPMMILSLTHDHRVMDGVDAANFLAEMKALLENPYPLFNVAPDQVKKAVVVPTKPTAAKPVSDKGASKFVEMLKKRGEGILGHVPAQMGLIGHHNPQLITDFVRMHRDALQDGALSSKTKALIALGIAVTIGCKSCMKWHLVEALEAGATDEEITEALGVTIFMGGGPSLMNAEEVADALEEFRSKMD